MRRDIASISSSGNEHYFAKKVPCDILQNCGISSRQSFRSRLKFQNGHFDSEVRFDRAEDELPGVEILTFVAMSKISRWGKSRSAEFTMLEYVTK